MRKTPIRHKVRSHTRKRGKVNVHSYTRGHGQLQRITRKKRIKRYGRYFPERIFYEECRRLAKEHPKWSRAKIEAEATVRLLGLNSNPQDKEFDVHLVQLQKMKGIEIEPLQWVGVMVKARVWKDGKPLGIGYYDSHAITRMGFKFRGKLAEKLKLTKKKEQSTSKKRKLSPKELVPDKVWNKFYNQWFNFFKKQGLSKGEARERTLQKLSVLEYTKERAVLVRNFEKLYNAYLKAVKGKTWEDARIVDVRKNLGLSHKQFERLITKIMIQYGAPHIEIAQPSLTLPKWKPVVYMGRRFWLIKIRKIKKKNNPHTIKVTKQGAYIVVNGRKRYHILDVRNKRKVRTEIRKTTGVSPDIWRID